MFKKLFLSFVCFVSLACFTGFVFAEDLETQELKNSEIQETPQTQLTLDFPLDTSLFKKERPQGINLIKNASFEVLAADWSVDNPQAILSLDTTQRLLDSSSLSLSSQTPTNLAQTLANLDYLKGKKLIFACWIKTNQTDKVRLLIDDGLNQSPSSYHTGDNTWQFLSTKATIDTQASQVKLTIEDNSTETIHLDAACSYELTKDTVYSANPQDNLKMPNNLIFTDLQNQRVGINTNIPQEALEVQGNIRSTGSILSGNNEVLTQTTADALYVNQVGDTMAGDLSVQGNINVSGNITGLKFLGDGSALTNLPLLWTKKEGTENIYYDKGNVGIGTTEPDSILDVRGQVQVSDEATPDTDAYASFGVTRANAPFNNSYIGLTKQGIIPWGIGIGSNDEFIIGLASADPIRTIPTPIFAIKPWPGNVGIGTVGPNGKLAVMPNTGNYSEQFTVSGWAPNLNVDDLNLGFNTYSSGNYPARIDTNHSGWSVQTRTANVAGTDASASMSFSYYPVGGDAAYSPVTLIPATTAINSILTLQPSGGNVGIGTTTPDYNLDVSGDIRATGNVYGNIIGSGPDSWVNAKAFGAVGDGSNDDTSAIQTAINSLPNGGLVYIPTGTYSVTTIKINTNITLRGDGMATVFKQIGGNYYGIYAEDVDNVMVDSLFIDSSAASSSSGIAFKGVRNGIVRNVTVYKGHEMSFAVINSANRISENCIIENSKALEQRSFTPGIGK